MSRAQMLAVAITVGLNALDGFDVLSISFASPGIMKEWGIDRAALGAVLSAELFGMAAGSILLGGVTDRIGRRPMILACLVVMTIGMMMVTTTDSIATLMAWRVFTGLGIGGMLAATNATVAEYSNRKSRNLSVALMAIGYPVGALLGGFVAAELLKGSDWRAVFHFGSLVTLAFIPIVWFLLPETVPFLCQRRPANALAKINKALARMGHAAVGALPEPTATDRKHSIADILKPGLLRITVLVTLAYFCHIATFYFILKWVPTIVTGMDYDPSQAAGVLNWANAGGATGGIALGLLARRFSLKPLIIIVLLGSLVAVTWFGSGQTDLAQLSMVVAIAGFFTNGAIVALYAIFAQAFPTHVRATGTGFAIGVGRFGAFLSPLIAGVLFESGVGLQGVAIMMAAGSGIAILAILLLPHIEGVGAKKAESA